ncbi:MAG: diguanylate cyclase [Firmicutes bacterium]|nr:diguanylate cyclase [Bacillota bacterium]
MRKTMITIVFLFVLLLFFLVYGAFEMNKLGTPERGFFLVPAGVLLLLSVLSLLVFKNYHRLKANYLANSILNEILETYINANQSFIYLKDENLRYLLVNKALADFYGKEVRDVIGGDVFTFADEEFAAFSKRTDLKVLTAMTVVEEELIWRDQVFAATKFPVKLANGRYGVGAYIRDVTEEYNNKRELIFLSFHDPLTGLYNRRYVDQELKRLDIEGNLPLTVMIGDVNGLKLTNDVFGHKVGDLLLKKAAEVLTRVCQKPGVVIARWGGDEFILFLPRTTREEGEKLRMAVKAQFAQERINDLPGSISLGCATKNTATENLAQVLSKAEERMYLEKANDSERFSKETIQRIIKSFHERFPQEAEHAQRVSRLSVAIGQALQLSPSQLNRLKQAGFLHDLGKIVLAESLLATAGPLTEEKSRKLKEHPVAGYRIANASPQTMEVARYLLTHHEHWDGSGYPKGLRGAEIPRTARIIAVADCYDQLRYGAPGQKPLSPADALAVLKREAGKRLDPEIVQVFLAMVESGSGGDW